MKTLLLNKGDEGITLRLVTALVRAWPSIPPALQGRLISEASLMTEGETARSTSSADVAGKILDFIRSNQAG